MIISSGLSKIRVFPNHWLLGSIGLLCCLNFLKNLTPALCDPWQRKALIHSWRKWTRFEFWPAALFYLPIIPYYIYLSLKYRSIIIPFYANPNILNGGLIGESKWDFLMHLSPQDTSSLKTFKISKDLHFTEARASLEQYELSYPFVIKPDIGQRGFAVRIIHSDSELKSYFELSNFDKIFQELSILPFEAGVFYIRKPSAKYGFIFSLTDKQFPSVKGDGITKLGDLILRDSRARIIASTYFGRFKDRLDSIPKSEEVIVLTQCGNHCQGAIFSDGKTLITEKLTSELDRISKQIPDFHFGRFDVRYKNLQSLKEGRDFEIVEINGAGSEATHIWDGKQNLIQAYLTLFAQYRLLFEVGDAVKRLKFDNKNIKLGVFLIECMRVALRKESLSLSS